ncbi:hypothetical protein FQN50_001143 [Emmonsiellopsis sp. PD_5]|nr:hypothetical protein FQN50_001143 [Emmonsiellopsis sp. PD_5]
MSPKPHLDQVVEEKEKKKAKIDLSDDHEDDNDSNLQAATPESFVTVSENIEDDDNDCHRKDGDPNHNAHIHLPEKAQKAPEKPDTLVDIRGIPKRDLIRALWENSKAAGLYAPLAIYGFGPRLDLEAATDHVENSTGYFDYLDGRVMKCNLSGDEVNVWGYDRDNGSGAFARVVEDLRKKLLAETAPQPASRYRYTTPYDPPPPHSHITKQDGEKP